MKSIVYTSTGPSSVLSIVEREMAEPGPGEVRVRVVASGVNPTDWKARAGGNIAFPEVVPNQDGAGVVDAVGDGVTGHAIGDRVWMYLAAHGRPTGTAQEFSVVPAERAVVLPDGVDVVRRERSRGLPQPGQDGRHAVVTAPGSTGPVGSGEPPVAVLPYLA